MKGAERLWRHQMKTKEKIQQQRLRPHQTKIKHICNKQDQAPTGQKWKKNGKKGTPMNMDRCPRDPRGPGDPSDPRNPGEPTTKQKMEE